jgi:hypothetical protein
MEAKENESDVVDEDNLNFNQQPHFESSISLELKYNEDKSKF